MSNVYGCFFDCHVVRACEIKYTNDGLAIGSFSIAVNDSVKRNGQWVDEPNFFECLAFGKVAETLKTNVVSGQRMFFQMKPKQERWKDNETGKTRSRVVFRVESFSFGERPKGAKPASSDGNIPDEVKVIQQQFNGTAQIVNQQQQYAEMAMNEDIPF